jgi:hypothetical protein
MRFFFISIEVRRADAPLPVCIAPPDLDCRDDEGRDDWRELSGRLLCARPEPKPARARTSEDDRWVPPFLRHQSQPPREGVDAINNYTKRAVNWRDV